MNNHLYIYSTTRSHIKWRSFSIYVACVSLATFVNTFFVVQAWAGELERTRVVPDSTGAIEEIILHYRPDMSEDLYPFYRDLFAQLSPAVRIIVVCPYETAAEEFITTWVAPATKGGRYVELVVVDREITLWARDRRIARQYELTSRPADQFVPIKHKDYEEAKYNEIMMIPDLVQMRFMPKQISSRIFLEGGNVVSNNRHAFLGVNIFNDSNNMKLDRKLIEKELSEILGVTPIIVKDREGNVPFCHVDMYLTALDDNTLLVADPRTGCEIILGRNALTQMPYSVLEEIDNTAKTFYRYDSIASEMRKLGYRVIRIPAVVNKAQDWMITYNNVLIDRHGQSTITYMPIYRIPALDKVAAKIYDDLGCDVKTIDVSKIYKHGGAVRCTVNVTQRKLKEPVQNRCRMTQNRYDRSANQDRFRDVCNIPYKKRTGEKYGIR
ncbi:MAG: agmatine deiminase family protein [Planctomycetota bacterium]|jgi:N-dimethylarginine dimethylaminohydrolase